MEKRIIIMISLALLLGLCLAQSRKDSRPREKHREEVEAPSDRRNHPNQNRPPHSEEKDILSESETDDMD
jgi:hypothetical protein